MKEASLPAGKTMRTFARGVEHRRYHDRFFEEWFYPVVKPELNIRAIPEKFTYFAEFSHDPPISVIQHGRRHILQGTLMPHQKMGLRWFPEGNANSREFGDRRHQVEPATASFRAVEGGTSADPAAKS
jgi:hypothetical protein